MGTFWIPLAGQKCSFDHVIRHLALFSRAGFKIKGEIQRVFTRLNQIFRALNWVTTFGAFEIVTGSITTVLDFFMRNYKNSGFFFTLQICMEFLNIFRINVRRGKMELVWLLTTHKSQRVIKENRQTQKFQVLFTNEWKIICDSYCAKVWPKIYLKVKNRNTFFGNYL